MANETNFALLKPCFLSSLSIAMYSCKKVKEKKIYAQIKEYIVQWTSIFLQVKKDRNSHGNSDLSSNFI